MQSIPSLYVSRKNHELSIKIALRNNRLIQLRTEWGLSQIALAQTLKMTNMWINAVECLRIKPFRIYKTELRWKKNARKISEFFSVSMEYIFPIELYKVKYSSFMVTGNVEQLPDYFLEQLESPDLLYDKKELREQLSKALITLSLSEEDVLTKIYFENKSISEIAKERELSVTRIGQIKNKALRKLRHPSRTIFLKDYNNNNIDYIF